MFMSRRILTIISLSLGCLCLAGSITNISPDKAAVGENVTLNLSCENTALTSDAVQGAALVRDSVIIIAESFNVVSNTHLEAVFSLPADMNKGLWSVMIELQNGDLRLENAFCIIDPDINGDGFVDILDFGYYANDFLDPMPGCIFVPGIVGMARTEAEAVITAAGLRVGSVQTQVSSLTPGSVIAQYPYAGVAVNPDETAVDIDISGGVPICKSAQIPLLLDIIGGFRTHSDAVGCLIANGFSVGEVIYENSSTVPQGFFISFDPPSGSYVSYSFSKSEIFVDIILSSEPQWGTVPVLRSLSVSEATDRISVAGFELGTVSYGVDYDLPIGHVISQNPAAGAEYSQPQDVSVDIVVTGLLLNKIVPDLYGLTPAQANSAITAAGFLVGTATNAGESRRILEGYTLICGDAYVCSQQPAPGTAVSASGDQYVNYSYMQDCQLIQN
jgi:beta-lactam-binding protein with PASTA domain